MKVVCLLLICTLAGASAQYRGEEVAAETTGTTGASASQPAFDLNKKFSYDVDFRNNLAEKFGSFNSTGAYNNFFNMTGVPSTPFGRLSAWVGDLIYPVALSVMIFFGVYVFFSIVFQVFGFAFTTKAGVFSAVINWLRATNNAIFSKVLKVNGDSADMTPEQRERRDLGLADLDDMIQLASQVYEAIDAFTNMQEN
ncbi:uncharacterized protein LOC131885866 [Tigriopus californicus]|uniref:uncharacterized protein LOC131885866 n=1 Tax=Tigriopus californicus TaxID=6832 RepID=UPI0027DA2AFD|nr:uncharacterized protein LOC131885866 [Tigriopus californicus]